MRMLLRGFDTNSDTSARQNLTIVLTPEFEKVSVLKIIYVQTNCISIWTVLVRTVGLIVRNCP